MGTTTRKQGRDNLVWIDLEMTGLDPQSEVILQAALIITDAQLTPLESFCVDIWQPADRLSTMVPFVRDMHTKNGLVDRCQKSTVDTRDAEQRLMEIVTGWCAYRPVLCGNTIGSDRKFIDKYMPSLAGYLHYRMVDVSSLKVLCNLWYPESPYDKPRDAQHDALFDIEQSIKELAHYRATMLRPQIGLKARPL